MPLFTAHVDKSWTFIKNECVIIMNTSLNHMVTNCFYLFCGIPPHQQSATHIR